MLHFTFVNKFHTAPHFKTLQYLTRGTHSEKPWLLDIFFLVLLTFCLSLSLYHALFFFQQPKLYLYLNSCNLHFLRLSHLLWARIPSSLFIHNLFFKIFLKGWVLCIEESKIYCTFSICVPDAFTQLSLLPEHSRDAVYLYFMYDSHSWIGK